MTLLNRNAVRAVSSVTIALALPVMMSSCGGIIKPIGEDDLDSGQKHHDGGIPFPGDDDGSINQTDDASFPPPPGFDGSTSSSDCPGPPGPIPQWKAPAVPSGACSAQDITSFGNAAQDQNATFQSLYQSLKGSPACQACIFSSESDANWQPVVWSPDEASGNAFINYGACYALAPGGSAACGQGIQDEESCIEQACPDSCTDQQTCAQTAITSFCDDESQEANTGCGASVGALNMVCDDFIQGLTVVCGQNDTD